MKFLQTVPVQHFLAPGAEILLLSEPRFKRCLVQVHFDRPLDDLSPARTLLAQVLQQGTQNLDSRMAIARRLEELFGATLHFGGQRAAESHTMTMSLSWVGERFLPAGAEVMPKLLDLAHEILSQPMRGDNGAPFDADVMQREQAQLIRQIESFPDDRSSYAQEQFFQAMCDGEAFGQPVWGSLSQAKELTAERLEEARTDLLQKGHMRVVAVGPIDRDQLVSALGEWFQGEHGLPNGERAESKWPAAVKPGELRQHFEEMDVDQARFHFGFRTPQYREPRKLEAALLANQILGGGVQGRLFRIIREERSLAYGIYSGMYSVKGMMVVSAGIDAGAFEEVRDEVRKQAQLLASEGPTEKEMDMAKVAVLNGMRSIGDAAGSMATFYGRESRLGFSRTPAQRAEMIEQLPIEEVQHAATEWKEDLCYLLRGPQGAENEELKNGMKGGQE